MLSRKDSVFFRPERSISAVRAGASPRLMIPPQCTRILRYQSPFYAKLTTINFNPAVAVKLGEHLSLGAGLDIMWSKLTLKQYYPWFLVTGNLGNPDGLAQAEADGIGAGANFGL